MGKAMDGKNRAQKKSNQYDPAHFDHRNRPKPLNHCVYIQRDIRSFGMNSQVYMQQNISVCRGRFEIEERHLLFVWWWLSEEQLHVTHMSCSKNSEISQKYFYK
jgi:hypothetical protein